MLKRLIVRLLGMKLPCGHGNRIKAKPGQRAVCGFCGENYLMAIWSNRQGDDYE